VRSYGFPGEDRHAFEHLVQWHSTILEGLAVMPKRSILSFAVAPGDDEQYHEGDFVVHLDGYSSLNLVNVDVRILDGIVRRSL